MFSRRGFLKAIFGASLGAVTKPMGAIVEALTTRKTSALVLNVVTQSQICEAKMFVIPFIELMTPVMPTKPARTLHGQELWEFRERVDRHYRAKHT